MNVRWVISRDIPQIAYIEECAFEEPWDEDDLRVFLGAKTIIGKVAEIDGDILGYVLYQICGDEFVIHRMAYEGPEVATEMIDNIYKRAVMIRRKVSLETDLSSSGYFSGLGFFAVECQGDMVKMVYEPITDADIEKACELFYE